MWWVDPGLQVPTKAALPLQWTGQRKRSKEFVGQGKERKRSVITITGKPDLT